LWLLLLLLLLVLLVVAHHKNNDERGVKEQKPCEIRRHQICCVPCECARVFNCAIYGREVSAVQSGDEAVDTHGGKERVDSGQEAY
jgi:hypothetical protein